MTGSAPKHAWTWRCDACGRPVADGHGYLQLVDPKTGGYPVWAEADERQYVESLWAVYDRAAAGSSPGLISTSDLDTIPEPERAQVQVWHRRCDPHPERPVYWIDIERINDPKAVLHWLAHLAEKTWLGRREFIDLIRRFEFGHCAKVGAQ